jgi:hypothetical protein
MMGNENKVEALKADQPELEAFLGSSSGFGEFCCVLGSLSFS